MDAARHCIAHWKEDLQTQLSGSEQTERQRRPCGGEELVRGDLPLSRGLLARLHSFLDNESVADLAAVNTVFFIDTRRRFIMWRLR